MPVPVPDLQSVYGHGHAYDPEETMKEVTASYCAIVRGMSIKEKLTEDLKAAMRAGAGIGARGGIHQNRGRSGNGSWPRLTRRAP